MADITGTTGDTPNAAMNDASRALAFAPDPARGRAAFRLDGDAADYTWREVPGGGLAVWNEDAFAILDDFTSLTFADLRLVREPGGGLTREAPHPAEFVPLRLDGDGTLRIGVRDLALGHGASIDANVIEAWAREGTITALGDRLVYEAGPGYAGSDEIRLVVRSTDNAADVRVIGVEGLRTTFVDVGVDDVLHAAGEAVSIELGPAMQDTQHGQNLLFTAEGLPPGIAIDPLTGHLTGEIEGDARVGDAYQAVVLAENGQGTTLRASFAWTVREPDPASELGHALGATPEGVDDTGALIEAGEAVGVAVETEDDGTLETARASDEGPSEDERSIGMVEGFTAEFDDLSALVEGVPLALAERGAPPEAEAMRRKAGEAAEEFTAGRKGEEEEDAAEGWDAGDAPLEGVVRAGSGDADGGGGPSALGALAGGGKVSAPVIEGVAVSGKGGGDDDARGGAKAGAPATGGAGSAPNSAPLIAVLPDARVDEDGVLAGIDLLAAASDRDGDTVELIGADARFGTVTLNGDGTVDYAPFGDFAGEDEIAFTVSDGRGGTTTGALRIEVREVNDAPVVATGTGASLPEDGALAGIDVLASAADADGDALTVSSASARNGTVSIEADGTLTYTPDADFSGVDTLGYTVVDGRGGEATGTVQLTVDEINDGPQTAVIAPVRAAEDSAGIVIDVLAGASDVDGTVLEIAEARAGHGTVTFSPQGQIVYTPDADFNGTDTVFYAITDEDGARATASVTVIVAAVNDGPTGGATIALTTFEDVGLTGIDALAGTADVDGDRLVVDDATADNGAVTRYPDGTLDYVPNADFSGTDAITVIIKDGAGGTLTRTIDVTVRAVNDGPVLAAMPSMAVVEDGSIPSIDVIASASDVDGDALSVAGASAANGTVAINPDGTLSYAPGANFTGPDTITYAIVDGRGGRAVGTLAIDVGGVNDAPVLATPPALTMGEDATASAIDVLSYASDPEGDPLTVIMPGAANGTVTVNADNTLTYTPDANFAGTDTITYTVDDGRGGQARGQIAVTVIGANDAPALDPGLGTLAVAEDGRIAGLDVVAGATDADGDPITVASAGAQSGTVTVEADGTLTYAPGRDFNGPDTITYTLSDGRGGMTTGRIEVDVTPVNDAPVAASIPAQNVAEDGRLSGIDVLSAATDADGDTLTVTAATAGSGTVTVQADSTLTYAPNANYTGPDTVIYTVDDGNGGTVTASFAVTVGGVNDAPVAGTVAPLTLAEDTASAPIDVLSLASDPDGDALAVARASAVNGTVAINPDGTLTYTPNADHDGVDTITYRLSDGRGGETDATIDVTVTSVNDAPDAGLPAATSVPSDRTVTVDLVGPASDAEGDAISLVSATADFGTATANPDGTLTYDPGGYIGPVSITYVLSDGRATTTATLAISSTDGNDAPIPGAGLTATTDEDVATTIDVLSAATDPDGDGFIVSAAGAANGSVAINPDGTLRYTPVAGFSGADEIVYTLTDARGAVATGTVDVTIAPVNDGPTPAAPFTVSVAEDGALPGIDVASGASDPEGDAFTVTAASAGNGTVAVNPDGTLDYAPDPDFNGTDVITYTLTDANGASSTGAVNVDVSAVNDAPVAGTPPPITVGEDTSDNPVDVLSHASDVDGDAVSVAGATAGSGSVTVAADGTVLYTPDANFAGIDKITYTLDDGKGGTVTSAIDVTVTAVNDAPVAGSVPPVTVMEDTSSAAIDVLSAASDPDGDPLSVIASTATNGTVVVNPDRTLTYTPDANFAGTDKITYTLDDGKGGTVTSTIDVTVTAVNDAPTGIGASPVIELHEDADTTAGSVHVATFAAADPDGGDAHTYEVFESGTTDPHPLLEVRGNHLHLRRGATLDYESGASIAYDVRATDSGGLQATSTGAVQLSDRAEHIVLGDGGVFFRDHGVTELSITGGAGDDEIVGAGTAPTAGGVIDGGAGDDTITGGDLDDTLSGGAGADILEGGAGEDHLTGGAGNDTLDGGLATDTVHYGGNRTDYTVLDNGDGTYTVFDARAGSPDGTDTLEGVEFVAFADETVDIAGAVTGGSIPTPGDDALTGTPGNDAIDGLAGNDAISGLAGDDTLLGGDGDDRIEGGAGDDAIDGGLGPDTAVYSGNRVDYAVTALGGDIYTVEDRRPGSPDGTDTVTAVSLLQFADGPIAIDAAAAMSFVGTAGADALGSTDFADTYWGLGGDDDLDGGMGDDVVRGEAGNDALAGGMGDDVLLGGDGDDTLDGGGGADVLDGGAGFDTVDYSRAAGGIELALADTDGFGAGGRLVNVAAGGHAGDALGDQVRDVEAVIGSAFSDAVFGAHTGTTAVLGDGDDVFDVTDDAGQGVDVVHGGAGNDTIVTGAGDDTLIGGAGSDYLWGQGGDDAIDGGLGHDRLAGGAGADAIDGGAGHDRLDFSKSGGGVDVLIGTGDADFAGGIYDGRTGGQTGDAAGDTYASIEAFTGTAFNDRLLGPDTAFEADLGAGDDLFDNVSSTATDTVDGGVGDDRIWAGGGDDVLSGGAGHDLIHGEDGNDAISGGAGDDTLRGGDGADSIGGGEGADILDGGAGDDRLTGGAGNDDIVGGAGTDTAVFSGNLSDYAVTDQGGGSYVVEDLRAGSPDGTDLLIGVEWLEFADRTLDVATAAGGPTPGDDVLIGTPDADTIDGLAGDDTIEGREGDDALFGNLGNDTIRGEGGNDNVDGDGGDDVLHGGAGNDLVVGDAGLDRLHGDAGDDQLYGGDDDDTLVGGAGADLLDGGAGFDTADYSGATEGVILALSDTDNGGIGGYHANSAAGGYHGEAAGDALTSIERVIGTDHGDRVLGADSGTTVELGAGNDVFDTNKLATGGQTVDGGTGNDTMWGSVGDDAFDGGDGNDTLDGESGDDVLRGGAGDDALVVDDGTSVVDGGTGSDTAILFRNFAEYVLTDNGDGTITATATGLTSTISNVEFMQFADVKLTTADALAGNTGNAIATTQAGGGGATADALFGTSGNDRLEGLGGEDVLWGGAGIDMLVGGEWDDALHGGSGWDMAKFSGNRADYDVHLGADGTVYVAHHANGGIDGIDALTGVEQLHFADQIVKIADAGATTGGTMFGGEGLDETHAGTADVDVLHGRNGNDALDGADGADIVRGGAGTDTVRGGAGDDLVDGGDGDDVIEGGTGTDTAYYRRDRADYAVTDLGGGTYEVADLVGQEGTDRVGGVEVFRFADGDVPVADILNGNVITGTPNADTLDGTAGDDIIDGLGGNDVLRGNGGDDILIGGAGADALDGGTGRDTVDYSNTTSGVRVFLEGVDGGGVWQEVNGPHGTGVTYANVFAGGTNDEAGGDSYVSIEDVVGSAHDDIVFGSAAGTRARLGDGNDWYDDAEGSTNADAVHGEGGNDHLKTGDGDDLIDGGDGDDVLRGQGGDDTIRGGAGFDTAYYSGAAGDYAIMDNGDGTYTVSGPDGTDTLSGVERLHFDTGGFADLSTLAAASPIVLDLDGSGAIETTGETTSRDKAGVEAVGRTVEFDIDGDGDLDAVEWVTGGEGAVDGILVDDRDGLAATDMNGARLFGDEGGRYADGYAKLSAWDIDGDGRVAGEEAAGLSLWLDDGDAIVDDGELVPLAEMGVTAIGVDVTEALDDAGRGLMRSVAETADGGTLMTEDVWFAREAAEVEADVTPMAEEMAA